jgi:hypothetical protein
MKIKMLLNLILISTLLLCANSINLKAKQAKFTPGPGDWKIVNKQTANCLKFVGAYQDNNASACDTSSSSIWNFELQGDNTHIVRSRANPQVLDVPLLSQLDGAIIHTWDWWGGANQKWFTDYIDGTYFMLRASHSSKCIGVSGSQLIQKTCNRNDASQLHSAVQAITSNIVLKPGVYYSIINKESGMCYRTAGAYVDNVHAGCDSAWANYWRFEKNDNWYIIRSLLNNQVMDDPLMIVDPGAIIHNWDWWGGNNQKWHVEPVGGEFFMIKNMHSGKCLHTAGGKFDQQFCNNLDNRQIFSVKEQPPTPIIPNTDYGIVN